LLRRPVIEREEVHAPVAVLGAAAAAVVIVPPPPPSQPRPLRRLNVLGVPIQVAVRDRPRRLEAEQRDHEQEECPRQTHEDAGGEAHWQGLAPAPSYRPAARENTAVAAPVKTRASSSAPIRANMEWSSTQNPKIDPIKAT
jgi:hypothetical protein